MAAYGSEVTGQRPLTFFASCSIAYSCKWNHSQDLQVTFSDIPGELITQHFKQMESFAKRVQTAPDYENMFISSCIRDRELPANHNDVVCLTM